jgi:hypothetical protein
VSGCFRWEDDISNLGNAAACTARSLSYPQPRRRRGLLNPCVIVCSDRSERRGGPISVYYLRFNLRTVACCSLSAAVSHQFSSAFPDMVFVDLLDLHVSCLRRRVGVI